MPCPHSGLDFLECTTFARQRVRPAAKGNRDWYLIAEHAAPTPQLAHPEGCAALRIMLVTVPRVSRSCMHFPDGFDLHLRPKGTRKLTDVWTTHLQAQKVQKEEEGTSSHRRARRFASA